MAVMMQAQASHAEMEQSTNTSWQMASVRVASSAEPDTARAVRTLLQELGAATAKLTLVFYGANHDAVLLARELDRVTGGRGVAGSTAGELNSAGFARESMSGISFHGAGVRAAVEVIPQLRELSLIPIVHLPGRLARGIGRMKGELDPERHLWLFLVNGRSGKEDLLTPFFMNAAPRVSLVGATLSDGADDRDARLIHHGRVYRDAAATILLEYDGPFEPFHHVHVEMTDIGLEITRTSRDGRQIERLDGQPALQAYAQALGVRPEQVDSALLATHPLGYRFRGQPMPISIAGVEANDGLRVGATVQTGQQLHILKARELVASSRDCIQSAIARVRGAGSAPEALLIFNCRLRHCEAAQTEQLDALAHALTQAEICGLNCSGEQFGTMHLNHSMTGVVFGQQPPAALPGGKA